MSDEEYEYEDYEDGEEEEEDEAEEKVFGEEEEAEEERAKVEETRSVRSRYSTYSDGEELLRARTESRKAELNEQLKDVINEWRKNRAKEEEELQRLKELQTRRKEIRAEEELKLSAKKREEEERFRREEAEKKAREVEEKRRRLEEAEKRRQAMTQKLNKSGEQGGLDIKKTLGEIAREAKREKVKTKEEQQEEKRIALSIRIKSLDLDGLGKDGLKSKADELWQNVIRLETEKYDLEMRRERQGYDFQELQTRQTQRLRLKAVRMGLDAEALTGKYPPKIQTASKFERRADNKTYEDKLRLYDGGWEILSCEFLEKDWKERIGDWNKQNRAKLPKWCGERPGKKSGEPSTPEEENVIDDVDDNIEEIGLIEDVPEVNEEEEDEEVEDEEEDEDYEYE